MIIILFNLIEILTVLVPVRLAVAYMTVIERKVMGSMQRRIGPNAVGYYGLRQPFADARKLIVKEVVMPVQSNKVRFYIAPMISMIFAVLGWAIIPYAPGLALTDWSLGILYGLALSSLGIYGVRFAGWSANSKWAFLGALRATAQMISYELVYSTSVLAVLLMTGSYNLTVISNMQHAVWYIVPLLPLLLIFFVSALAETNRTPFDMVEAESELVSGFITEHSGIIFVFFFRAEYCSIVRMSTFTVVRFFGGYTSMLNDYSFPLLSSLVLGLKAVAVMFVFVWVRATLPRVRYDQLMLMCWTQLRPIVFGILALMPCILIAFNIMPLSLPCPAYIDWSIPVYR